MYAKATFKYGQGVVSAPAGYGQVCDSVHMQERVWAQGRCARAEDGARVECLFAAVAMCTSKCGSR